MKYFALVVLLSACVQAADVAVPEPQQSVGPTLCTITEAGDIVRGEKYRDMSCGEYRHALAVWARTTSPGSVALCWSFDKQCGR